MGDKRILLAEAGQQALEVFRQALGEDWSVETAACGREALDRLEKDSCTVLVADLDLPESGGAELLNQAREKWPRTVRFVMATEAERERVVREVLGAHQFLTKPLDAPGLRSIIERALALDNWISNTSIRELVARIRAFPAIPSIYLEVLAALRSPSATTEEIGAIIAKDMAMTTKLLQVLNSAYYGVRRRVTDPAEAVGLMGFEAVKSMVMAIKLLSHYDKVKPVYFSIDRLWRHSTEVARLARDLVLSETADQPTAEAAYTAGLVHDLGKVILASNFDEQYRGVQSLARKQQVPLWEIEKEIFGATHGEIGAYLLGLWGMPLDLLETAALHHYPNRGFEKRFGPLTAVHVANVLEYRFNPDKEEPVPPELDAAYLEEIGMTDRIAQWCTARSSDPQGHSMPLPKPQDSAPAREMPASSPQPACDRQRSDRLSSARRGRPFIYATLGACGVLLMVMGLNSALQSTSSSPEYRRRGAPTRRQVSGSATEALPAEATQSIGTSNVPLTAAPGGQAAVSSPSPDSQVQPDSKLTNAAQASRPQFPALKLQGIFYSQQHPVVMVNGAMLAVNEQIAGARVVKINSSSVTLEFQNEQRTLTLK